MNEYNLEEVIMEVEYQDYNKVIKEEENVE